MTKELAFSRVYENNPKLAVAERRESSAAMQAAGFTPLASECVSVPRVRECPAQLECKVKKIHSPEGSAQLQRLTGGAAVETEVVRVHLREDYVVNENYVDSQRWQPLIYNFRHYFGLSHELGKTFRAEV